jgi:hypothetical protein
MKVTPMRPPLFDPRALIGWAPRIGPAASAGLRLALRWASHHTGLPAMLVAAIALVLSWRIIKRTLRLALEVVIAVACLVAATRLGWLSW